jgi:hypothetical protein
MCTAQRVDFAQEAIGRTASYPGKMLLTALEAKLITI